jgi:3-phenylpropionate/trans-cinnamate dioxygenase ferredoxin component
MTEEVRAKSALLPEDGVVRVEGGPVGVCLVRLGSQFFALADRCSHANWPLSDGEVDAAQISIECTKHGSTFSLQDGRPQCLPATRAVEVYPVRLEGDEVVVSIP